MHCLPILPHNKELYLSIAVSTRFSPRNIAFTHLKPSLVIGTARIKPFFQERKTTIITLLILEDVAWI